MFFVGGRDVAATTDSDDRDPTTTEPGEPLDPEDTFALVGNEVRAVMLEAPGEAREPNESRPRIPFSELRDRVAVDVRDE